jgi:hypothetical protein
LNNVKVTINGADAEVLFAGAQGEFVGLDQCNVRFLCCRRWPGAAKSASR